MSRARKSVIVLVLTLFFSVVCGVNVSTAAPALHPLSTIDVRPSGAIASFLKMLVDIPLALVEAFRDGAEGIEKIVLGSLRTFF